MTPSPKIVAAPEEARRESVSRLRLLGTCGYSAGALLIAIPILEFAARAFPPQLGNMTWRFVAGGLLSNAALLLVVGFALMAFTAANLGHLGVLRTLSALVLLCALGLFVAMASFMFDGMGMRQMVDGEGLLAFDIAFVKTELILVLAFGAGLLIGIKSWRESVRVAARSKKSAKHGRKTISTDAAVPPLRGESA